eukprot:3924210-Amphidinium_carterae.1
MRNAATSDIAKDIGVGGNAGQNIKHLGINRARGQHLELGQKAAFVELELKPVVLRSAWAHLMLSEGDFEVEALRAARAHEILMLFRPNKRGLIAEKAPAEDAEVVDQHADE